MKELRLDLHIHTWYSKDGIHPPSLILKTAFSKGLDVIALTDHNSVRGLKGIRGGVHGITIVPGIEVDTIEGHVIGLGIETEIKPWLTAAETIERIRDEGGISVIPHPFDYLRRGIGSRAKTIGADLIEVMNSRSNTPLANYWARRTADKIHSPITAGSDAHLAEDVGNVFLAFDNEESEQSVDSILRLLTSRRGAKPRVVGGLTPLSSRVRKIALVRLKRTSG
ncbi:MAG: CehA/McbA family metallohydrolase [Promethearchaeati archaeon SRVP18_Atabeyarchaeia-1]